MEMDMVNICLHNLNRSNIRYEHVNIEKFSEFYEFRDRLIRFLPLFIYKEFLLIT